MLAMHDAFYTVLIFAEDKCEEDEQHKCVVTSDPPLYATTVDVVSAEAAISSDQG